MTTYSTRAQLIRVKAWRELVERIESPPRTDGTTSHYFDRATIKHWRNIWHGTPFSAPYSTDLYYVESAQPFADPRTFAVKVCRENGLVDTISDYPHYATEAEAASAARFVAGVTL